MSEGRAQDPGPAAPAAGRVDSWGWVARIGPLCTVWVLGAVPVIWVAVNLLTAGDQGQPFGEADDLPEIRGGLVGRALLALSLGWGYGDLHLLAILAALLTLPIVAAHRAVRPRPVGPVGWWAVGSAALAAVFDGAVIVGRLANAPYLDRISGGELTRPSAILGFAGPWAALAGTAALIAWLLWRTLTLPVPRLAEAGPAQQSADRATGGSHPPPVAGPDPAGPAPEGAPPAVPPAAPAAAGPPEADRGPRWHERGFGPGPDGSGGPASGRRPAADLVERPLAPGQSPYERPPEVAYRPAPPPGAGMGAAAAPAPATDPAQQQDPPGDDAAAPDPWADYRRPR